MCCKNREARRTARPNCATHRQGCCGRCAAAGPRGPATPAFQHQPRQGIIRQLVNNYLEMKERKRALADGQYVQPKTLAQGEVQQLGGNGRWVYEKQNVRTERLARDGNVGRGVEDVGQEQLPSYGEAVKN